MVLGLVAAAVGTVVASRRGDAFPKQWDPRVEPIARWVAKERGLPFEHAVHVDFLSPSEYRKIATGGDTAKVSAADRREAEQAVGQLRALGLVEGKVDLLSATRELTDSGTLAFYSQKSKRIYIRGTTVSPSLRVTLAHELTHVLQDQHFDLTRIERMDGDVQEAFRAMVEGDAERIEKRYEKTLSAADRTSYDAEQKKEEQSSTSLESKVPEVLITYFGAPYAFGGRMIDLLEQMGGQRRVNDVIRTPPKTSEQVFDPRAWIDRAHDRVHKVATPAVPRGAKRIDKDTMGSLTWYLFLSRRIDARMALAATDGWGGDAYVAYREGAGKGRVCVKATFVGDTARDTTQMSEALDAWAARMPTGSASVQREPGSVGMTSCDPGDSSAAATGGLPADKALALPISRTDLLTALLKQGADMRQAGCFADKVINALTIEQLTDDDGTFAASPGGQALFRDSMLACR